MGRKDKSRHPPEHAQQKQETKTFSILEAATATAMAEADAMVIAVDMYHGMQKHCPGPVSGVEDQHEASEASKSASFPLASGVLAVARALSPF